MCQIEMILDEIEADDLVHQSDDEQTKESPPWSHPNEAGSHSSEER